LELSETVKYAAGADAGILYVRGNASSLPFADSSFDLVVADNSLMDIEDMHGAVAETETTTGAPGGG
jgi:ubiquinone/menaquinone biosynthesis C-methylase UbiE